MAADNQTTEDKLNRLFQYVEVIINEKEESSKRQDAFDNVSLGIQPQHLHADVKHVFVQRVAVGNLVDVAVQAIETGNAGLASSACDFLGDLSFNSDLGSQIVLKCFDRIIECFVHAFRASRSTDLVRSFVSLCANIVATSPEWHPRLIPLVSPFFLQIIQDTRASDRLLSSTVLLLANLALTIGQELRERNTAQALMELVLDADVAWTRKSVAESVIIFLLGHQQCIEIDELLELNVIEEYCIPILRAALDAQAFRGMYPHLVYSAHLFHVLSRSQVYAEVLVNHEEVVHLLVKASLCKDMQSTLESNSEGRRLALETLCSLVRFRLWPAADTNGERSSCPLDEEMPMLLDDAHAGVRTAAAAIWGHLHRSHIVMLFLVGDRLDAGRQLPRMLWRQKILPFVFPFITTIL